MFKKIQRYVTRVWLVIMNQAYVYDKKQHENMQHHWGQCAEDVIVTSLLRDVHYNGFYVDVGAHHPTSISNTYWFYRLGWRGINIDASKESIDEFNTYRPRDTNLHMGVSNSSEKMEFHRFESSVFNTFDAEMAKTWQSYSNKLESRYVQCNPLSTILAEYVPVGTDIDLLTIDVEGMELVVINSSDWERFRPKVVVVEQLERSSILAQCQSALHKVLERHGYTCVAIAGHSQYFLRADVFSHYLTIETA